MPPPATDGNSTVLTVTVLGPFEARTGPTVLDLGGPQQRAVLALLALDAGRVVPAERLITRLWGDEPPASALGTLQSYVSRLRRVLEPGRVAGAPAALLVSEAPGYVLRVAPEQVDAHRFTGMVADARAAVAAGDPVGGLARYDDALALWRGPALAGLGLEASTGALVVHLEEQRDAAVEERADVLLALGRHASAVPALQAAVAERPLREQRWSQLATALYRSGRQADALRALAAARETLAEELGLDPGPELRALEARILAQDPSLAAAPMVAAPPGPGAPTAWGPAAGASAGRAADRSDAASETLQGDVARLVGRDDEFAVLADALRTATGASVLVLVDGEAGIGKTALLDELVARAAGAGFRAVRGRGVEEGLAPALWPWSEIVRSLVEVAAPADRPLAGRPALDFLVTPGSDREGPPSLAQLAADLVGFLHDLSAAGPLLLVFDDLHWADPATLEVLGLVAAQLRDAPVLVVAAHRPPDLGDSGPLATALGALARAPRVHRLALRGLGPDDVGRVLGAIAGTAATDDVVRRVHARTAGNPLFVTEFSRLLRSERPGAGEELPVPAAVRDVLRRRFARLPERTLDVLAVAAVIGPEFDLRVLTAATGLAPDRSLDDLEPAVVSRVVVPANGGRFRFGHALVRDAVLADLSPLRRARLHIRAADAIEEVHGADADHAEPIAAHRWAARAIDDPLAVVEALVRAIRMAHRHNALDTADELVERALEAVGALTGDTREYWEIDVVEWLLTVETTRTFMSRNLDEIATRIEAMAARANSDIGRALALFVRWSVVNQARYEDAAPYAERAHTLGLRSATPYVNVLGAYCAGVQAWIAGRVDEAADLLERALVPMEVANAPGSDLADHPRVPPVDVFGVAALVNELAGRHARAEELIPATDRWMSRRGIAGVTPDSCLVVALTLAIRGDVIGARAWADRGLGPEAGGPVAHFTPALGVLRGWARVQRGDRAGADEADAAMTELDAGDTKIVITCLRGFHAAALLAAGRPGDARRAATRALDDAHRTGERFWLTELERLRDDAAGRAPDATGSDHAEQVIEPSA